MGEPSVQIKPSGETPLGPRLPLRLGRFVLCAELGSGGMATVYLARMQLAAGLERLVALKTIHPHLAKEKAFVDMFLDEARIASHVTHPNVCSTHDFGEVDKVYYLAMEYLLGEPVFDVINRLVERFDDVSEVLPYIAARIVADACEGLHAAHVARGPDGDRLHIVHRDVSPQNLFLTYDGAVKVVDFGCAKAAERVAHTSTGVMKGKVGYAAPEQIKGYEADARADVWALGVCLWETLTLSPLFSRSTAVATAMAVLEEPIELASDGRDWVPDEVARIADKALSRDADGRYASARDMGRALRKFIADSGFTLESAELAEWMDFLFDEKHQQREREASLVQEMDISEIAAVPLYEVTDADVESLDSGAAPFEAIPYDDDDDLPEAPEVTGPMPKVRRRRASEKEEEEVDDESAEQPDRKAGHRTMLVLFVVTLISVSAYVLHYYYEPAPWLFGAEPAETSETPVEPEPRDEQAIEQPPVVDDTDGTSAENTAADDRDAPAVEAPSAEPSEPARPSTTRRQGRSARRGSATPAPATPQAPEADTGSVHITASPGWAEIWEGGRRLGRTPLTRELSLGAHRLSIRPNGDASEAVTETVHVSAIHAENLSLDIPAQ